MKEPKKKKVVWRIGEILIQNGWVKWEHLTKALEIQTKLQNNELDDPRFLKQKKKKGLSLGELLVLNGSISWDNLEIALSTQRLTGRMLGEICLENKFIGEPDLYKALAQQMGVPFIDLSKVTLNPKLREIIPKDFAEDHQAVPVAIKGQDLMVVFADIHDPEHEIALKKLKLDYEVISAVACPSQVSQVVEEYYKG